MLITVEIPGRSYDVVIEHNARHLLSETLQRRAPRAQHAVVLASDFIQRQPWFDIEPGLPWTLVSIPDGESAKRLSTIEEICGRLSNLEISRRDVIVSVGGGAATDVAGFAAAVYLRGIDVVHIATSLVAQVDAAIGGKTGVNLPVGKNLIGAFHQPLAVLCDLATLDTLDYRDRLSGLGEIAKCWILEGRTLDDLQASSESDWISVAVSLKASLVAADEREGGSRALLNYGHTLAHAIEAGSLSGGSLDVRHGEAVSIGMAFAIRLAKRLGRVGDRAVRDHDDLLDFLQLPRSLPPNLDPDNLMNAMARDKKAHHALAFVLAGADGFSLVSDIDPLIVRDVLELFKGES